MYGNYPINERNFNLALYNRKRKLLKFKNKLIHIYLISKGPYMTKVSNLTNKYHINY